VAITARRASGDQVSQQNQRIRSRGHGSECKRNQRCLLCRTNVVHVVAQSDEQIKEQLRTAVEHLQLHGAAALESVAAADDEREIVRTQLRVRVGSVGVGISRGSEDGAALDARL